MIRLKIKTIYLTKSLFELEKKLRKYAWKFFLFEIVFLRSYFFIINSSNQGLIHHIHCFGYIFWIQDNEILLDLYVSILWFLHWILFIKCLLHLSFNKTSSYSLWLISATTCLSMHLTFCMFIIVVYQEWIHFWLQFDKSLIATPPISSLIFPMNTLFKSSYYFDLVELLLKSSISLSLLKSSKTLLVLIWYINYQCLWVIVLICCRIYF